MEFFIDLITNGLLVGLMYALVAVGFVLIYKATSIMNFAQGDLVMFAGYAAAVMLGLRGMPIWLMVLVLCVGMVALGFVLERWHPAAHGGTAPGLGDHGDHRFKLCVARPGGHHLGGRHQAARLTSAPGTLCHWSRVHLAH